MNAADYQRANALPEDMSVFDDWATVHTTDDGVAIRFAVKEQVRAVKP
ncbi:hypothetical protein ABT336_14435 [Micromonospora sp. NPDC000207]